MSLDGPLFDRSASWDARVQLSAIALPCRLRDYHCFAAAAACDRGRLGGYTGAARKA